MCFFCNGKGRKGNRKGRDKRGQRGGENKRGGGVTGNILLGFRKLQGFINSGITALRAF